MRAAQTDIREATDAPSASNFLEREKAVLGDDANQFATVEDADFDDNADDLLGAGMASPGGNAQFESQFPDITSPNEVCRHIAACVITWFNQRHNRASPPAVPSQAHQSATTPATPPTRKRRQNPR